MVYVCYARCALQLWCAANFKFLCMHACFQVFIHAGLNLSFSSFLPIAEKTRFPPKFGVRVRISGCFVKSWVRPCTQLDVNNWTRYEQLIKHTMAITTTIYNFWFFSIVPACTKFSSYMWYIWMQELYVKCSQVGKSLFDITCSIIWL